MKILTKLFKALGVAAINSQAFAGGYFYEYALVTDEDGMGRIVRRLRNNTVYSREEPEDETVETEAQMMACRQALMYNFPGAFNIDGSVAIDLSQVEEAEAEQEQESEDTESLA